MPEPPPPTRQAALFLDADGTLLDIAPTPEGVRIAPGLLPALVRLNAALGGAVAVISGRPMADLERLFGSTGIALIAEHGAERNGRAARPRWNSLPPDLVEALKGFAARHPGVMLETKAHGVALHFRAAPDAAAAAERLGHALAARHGDHVRLVPGKAVHEFVPLGVGKGRALAAALRRAAFRGRVPYMLGDDITDEDAFAVVNRRRGVSVLVGSVDAPMRPTRARFMIAHPRRVRAWLRAASVALSR